MLQRFFTRVWINNREFRVNEKSSVFSGPYAGGFFRELPNQGGANAVKARKMASGELFCEHAMTDIRFVTWL